MDEILDKYSDSCIKNFNKENIQLNLKFLKSKNCDYLNNLLEDYLDLLIMDNNLFIEKYNMLNKKYNGNFLTEASKNMNLLEEFFMDEIS